MVREISMEICLMLKSALWEFMVSGMQLDARASVGAVWPNLNTVYIQLKISIRVTFEIDLQMHTWDGKVDSLQVSM